MIEDEYEKQGGWQQEVAREQAREERQANEKCAETEAIMLASSIQIGGNQCFLRSGFRSGCCRRDKVTSVVEEPRRHGIEDE